MNLKPGERVVFVGSQAPDWLVVQRRGTIVRQATSVEASYFGPSYFVHFDESYRDEPILVPRHMMKPLSAVDQLAELHDSSGDSG